MDDIECPECGSLNLDATDYPNNVKCIDCGSVFGNKDENSDKVVNLVKQFVEKHQIRCPETIYQCDWVIENAYEFIEKLCDIVGYYQDAGSEEVE